MTEFINACNENKRLALKHIDLSVNNICDEGGVKLAKCFKNLKNLESINLKNNSLEWESSDAYLYLVKENHTIFKCNLELNMIKYLQVIEIEKTCKNNKYIVASINIPQIKKEIKGLKRAKNKEIYNLSDLNE